jgi:hypothetical protein
MAETRFIEKPIKKKKVKTEEKDSSIEGSLPMTEEKRQKLKELDEFIDDVLEKAGDDFLEEFRQVEGE